MEVDVRHTQGVTVSFYYNPDSELIPTFVVKVESTIPELKGSYVLETSDPVEALDFYKHPMVHCLNKVTIANLMEGGTT